MTLEKAIEENTRAIYDLIDALGRQLPGIRITEDSGSTFINVKAEATERPTFMGAPLSEQQQQQQPQPPEKKAKGKKEKTITYQDVKSLVLELAAEHRAEIKEIFTANNIAKLGDVLVEQNNEESGSIIPLEKMYSALRALNGSE